MHKIIYTLFLFVFAHGISAQVDKRPLTLEDMDQWESVSSTVVSDNGQLIVYQVRKQNADPYVQINKLSNNSSFIFARANSPIVTKDASKVILTIKPHIDSVRHYKLKGKKGDDLPQDSLKIWDVASQKLVFTSPRVKSISIGEKSNTHMVFRIVPEGKKSKVKDHLIVLDLKTLKTDTIKNVSEYKFDELGKAMLYVIDAKKDSLVKNGLYKMNMLAGSKTLIDTIGKKFVSLSLKDLDNFSYYSSQDSAKAKNPKYTLNIYQKSGLKQFSNENLNLGDNLVIDPKNINYSDDGSKLYFNVKYDNYVEKDTTKLDDELAEVDVWAWNDYKIQTVQQSQKNRIINANFTCVYNFKEKSTFIIEQNPSESISFDSKKNADLLIISNEDKYLSQRDYDYPGKYDFYTFNLKTGERKLILQSKTAYPGPELSPDAKYISYFNYSDSSWYSLDLKTQKHIKLTENKAGNEFYNIENDIPSPAGAIASAIWSSDGKYLVVQSTYDLWRLDPSGRRKALNLTKSFGQKNKISFSIINLDREEKTLPAKGKLLLLGFNKTTKESSIYSSSLSGSSLSFIEGGKFKYSRFTKAEQADLIVFAKEDPQNSANLYHTALRNWKPKKSSDINKQQSNFVWHSVELLSFKTKEHGELNGMLYLPENFDRTKKYPMVVYFYERYSDELYRYVAPSLSRSTVNYSYLTSNGYLVFVPDITYKTGQPGKDAYDCIMSGVEEVEKKGFVDADRIAIQGQSWGGYQVAYLVTQTDKFACAFAGAPVSNMTSAYGGIRWESGMSREFQYERTQSRIGSTLWDAFDKYIDNSPLFFAPKVNTPLLIMHNDQDGAVPYYQGIEYFMALRRLNKPVWLLVYNKEAHNLTQRKNMKDLSIRMYQFFDYYLKDQPAPKWMINGVPIQDKGIDYGYELMK